jgi:hypothetical protein
VKKPKINPNHPYPNDGYASANAKSALVVQKVILLQRVRIQKKQGVQIIMLISCMHHFHRLLSSLRRHSGSCLIRSFGKDMNTTS